MTPYAVIPALYARGLYPEIQERLGITRQAIDSWRVVPAERVIAIAKISGLKPHIIRPDIFPDANGKTFPINGRRTAAAQRRLKGLTLRRRRRRPRPSKQRRKSNGKGRIERRDAGASQGSL
jgi:hypothetical protein